MKLKHVLGGMALGGVAWLVYGALVESKKIVVERKRLRLPGWPERLNGFKIALLADFHIRDPFSIDQAQRAIGLALDEAPDMVVLAGDFVGYWKPHSPWQLAEILEPLLLMQGAVVAVPGNHDYWHGDASLLAPILDEFNIKLLRNEAWHHAGITWIGVDSHNAHRDDAPAAFAAAESMTGPAITVWHEPDAVDQLPSGSVLMLSGHSHGGQWKFPGGWTPMRTQHGEKYIDGFYPDAPTPLYVTRGVGTTGPPARFGALADVSILTLDSV